MLEQNTGVLAINSGLRMIFPTQAEEINWERASGLGKSTHM